MSAGSTEHSAARDCRFCQRRRIKCDRGLPSCRKCSKRGLECPGYGLQLKWVDGVASRGNLRGRAVPSLDAPVTTAGGFPTERNTLARDITVPNVYKSDTQIHSASSGPLQFPISNICLSPSRPLHISQLLRWFNERVAHRLAWVPHQSAWRQMILPMAESSETVLSSILAIAAHDLASEYPPNEAGHMKFQDISSSYQDRSLALLARELNRLSSLSSAGAVEASTTSAYTLASVIILCNNEFMKPQGAGWRVHLSAARQIILAAGYQPYQQNQLACIQEFLLLEFYETSVWADLTNFKDDELIVKTPPASTENAVFTDFIRVIDQITRLERLKFRSESSGHHCSYGVMQDILSQITSARDGMIRLSGSIPFASEADRRGFELVVWMYYHATLIYCHQALSSDSASTYHVKRSRDEIIRYVQTLSENRDSMFAQDLVWPLFLAGTELKGDIVGQKVIRESFANVMRISRSLDRARVLSFVESWWNDPGTYTSWIDMARKQSQLSQCDILIL
ncbi:hypothetical protein N7535_003629 [Penicillium sp. DV-2018c]|nr:hypothetical protein N7461_000669 [Penicillium sp. DV-2018c]KAJ5576703.1 hypothetical protein N7535_003629 [Penicillium sp. DV-2018c]